MLIVLRKSSIKRTVALSILLILVGLSLRNSPLAQASESNLYYLYPSPSNNPSQTALFWSESNPKLGAYNLAMWSQIVPNKQIVVGLPEGYGINAAMIGDNLGKYVVTKIGNRLKNGKKEEKLIPPPKDSITYERDITSDGIKEKIRVEIGEHFRDNDNFERYVEVMKKGLTNKNELPDRAPVPQESPAPQGDTDTAQVVILGNTLILSGAALILLKLLPLLAL